MPRLPNVRHEKFARNYLRYGKAGQAYVKAGYQVTTPNSRDVCACRLLRHAHVAKRIKELQRMSLNRHLVTVDTILNDLATDRENARNAKQLGVAVRATELMAKVKGLMVDRKEVGAPGDFSGLEDREAILSRLAIEAGPELAALLTRLLDGNEAEAMLIEHDATEVPKRYPSKTGGT